MGRNVTLSVSVDHDLEVKLISMCTQTGQSVSGAIREAIQKMLKEKETEGSAPNEQV